jgi:transaldolase
MNGLEAISNLGVSVWLDDLGRRRIVTGELANLIADRCVVGVTTNPSIFAKAVGDGADYADQLAALARSGADATAAVRALTTDDVRKACDVFTPVHLATHGLDGRVSIEVDPRLAADTDATVNEAQALWDTVDRPNLFIKIPGTKAGLPAITTALSRGISVNVTLIFGLPRYAEVVDAWLSGLEQAAAAGHDLSQIASVASFFVSRVDTAYDKRLDAIGTDAARAVRGAAAIANARLAYAHFLDVMSSPRWQALAAAGTRPQRPLWASTSTKDPTFDDTRYVTELVADHTVNTMPLETLQAVADHGVVHGPTIGDASGSRIVMQQLAELGIDYDEVVQELENDGVAAFEKAWLQLIDSVDQAMAGSRG